MIVSTPASAADPVAGRGQRVGQDRQPQAVRLGDGGAHRLEPSTAASAGSRSACSRRPTPSILIASTPAFFRSRTPRDDGLGRVGLAAEEPVVAGGRRDRRTRRPAGADLAMTPSRTSPTGSRVPRPSGCPVSRAVVAPDSSERAHRLGRPDERAFDRLGPRDLAVVGRRREVHVDVRLDEARQQRHVAEVVDLVGRARCRTADRRRCPTDSMRPSTISTTASASQPSSVAFATRAARTSCRVVMRGLQRRAARAARRRPADRVAVADRVRLAWEDAT